MNVLLDQVGSDCRPWFAFRRDGAMVRALGRHLLLSHETGYPFARTPEALGMQFCMDTGTPIDAAMALERLSECFCQKRILLGYAD